MFFSMFLFVQLSISAYALPTNVSALDERGFLDKLTGNDIVIGYRFVDQDQASTEYNHFRTLRVIPATDEKKELLESTSHIFTGPASRQLAKQLLGVQDDRK
ncbi:hypothetical protein F5879DRAFT_523719 [Lentinula edodes]|nr:hypothetical protein F5879DRAFT_523719 [Lentinula edodes]